ncbi:MAG: hypothetical protein ACRDYW_12315 [Acidimicrobiales bacterium]
MTALADAPSAPPQIATPPGGSRRELLALLGLLVLGLGARAVLLASPIANINSDEATTGIQAIELWRGRLWTFVPGNVYGGNADVFLAAPFELVLPASVLRLKVLASLTWLAAAAVVYVTARRRTGASPALLAAAVIWVPSAALVHLSTMAFPGYASGLLATAVVAFGAAELDDRPPRWPVALLVGACAGLAVWQHPLYLYAVAPFVAWAAWRHRRSGGVLAAMAVGGATSVAVPVIHNLRNDFPSLGPRADPPTTYGTRVRDWLGDLLPRATGGKWLNDDWVLGPAGRPVVVVAVLAVAGLAVVALVKGRGHARVAAAVALAAPFGIPLFSGAWFTADARYAIVALVPVALAVAHGAARLDPRRVSAIATVVVVGWVLVAVAVPFAVRLDEVGGERTMAPLAEALEERGITRVRTDYWIAYQLTYETDEAIVASPLYAVRFGHYESLVRDAEAAGQAAVVLPTSELDTYLATAPDRADLDRIEVDRYTILLPPTDGGSP